MKLLKEYEATEGQDGEKLLRLIFLILCHHLSGASCPRLPYRFDCGKTFLTFPTEEFCHCSGSSVYHFQVPERDFLSRHLSTVHHTFHSCSNWSVLICAWEHMWCLFQKMFVWQQIGKQSETGRPYYTTKAEVFLIFYCESFEKKRFQHTDALLTWKIWIVWLVFWFCGENSEPARYIYETVNFIDIVSFVRSY